MLTRLRAVLWLHLIRLWRYKWSFLNRVAGTAIWVLLYLMGALLFAPPGRLAESVRVAFWVVAGWTIISSFASLIGGWTNFFISIGMMEEHVLRGFSPFKVLLGRVVTGISVSLGTLAFIGALLGGAYGVDVLGVEDPLLCLAGLALLSVEAASYGFLVSSISVRTTVPYSFLNILNMSTIVLLMVPADALPGPAGLVLLLVPYAAPGHLIKASVGAASALIWEAGLISTAESLTMALAALEAVRRAEDWMRRSGVRAVGYW